MKVLRLAVIAAVLASAIVLPATASAATTNPYRYYVACGWSRKSAPSHSCSVGSNKAAFFKSKGSSITYKVCTTYPTAIVICANGQSAPLNTWVKVKISATAKGQYTTRWYTGLLPELKIGQWSWNVT
jgi:hypothetical protein